MEISVPYGRTRLTAEIADDRLQAILCSHLESYVPPMEETALVEAALDTLQAEGIHKAALVVFGRNEKGNAFWEKLGFTTREDLVYRNKTLTEMVRIDT